MKRPWPALARTLAGDHPRYEQTYFGQYKGYYFTGDGARRDEDGQGRQVLLLVCPCASHCAWEIIMDCRIVACNLRFCLRRRRTCTCSLVRATLLSFLWPARFPRSYYWISGRVDDVINVSGHRLGTAEARPQGSQHASRCGGGARLLDRPSRGNTPDPGAELPRHLGMESWCMLCLPAPAAPRRTARRLPAPHPAASVACLPHTGGKRAGGASPVRRGCGGAAGPPGEGTGGACPVAAAQPARLLKAAGNARAATAREGAPVQLNILACPAPPLSLHAAPPLPVPPPGALGSASTPLSR